MITQTKKPKKFRCYSVFNNDYLSSFSSDNSFPIRGSVPLNPTATALEAVTPIRLPERTVQGKVEPPATPSPSSSRDNFSRSQALQREIRGDMKIDSWAKCLSRRKNKTESKGEPVSLEIVDLHALVFLRPIDKSRPTMSGCGECSNVTQRTPNWRRLQVSLSDVSLGAPCTTTVSPRTTMKTYVCVCDAYDNDTY